MHSLVGLSIFILFLFLIALLYLHNNKLHHQAIIIFYWKKEIQTAKKQQKPVGFGWKIARPNPNSQPDPKSKFSRF